MTTETTAAELAAIILDTPRPDRLVYTGEARKLPMFHLSTLLEYGNKVAEAAALLRAGAAKVPSGWKLVPIEPTEEMIQAANDGDRAYTLRGFGPDMPLVMQGPHDHWCAMIAATPPAPDAGVVDWPQKEVGVALIQVFHLGDGDEPFVCGASGHVTAEMLVEIDADFKIGGNNHPENDGDKMFDRGPGDYLFKVSTHFDNEFQCRRWFELERVAHKPLPLLPNGPGGAECVLAQKGTQ